MAANSHLSREMARVPQVSRFLRDLGLFASPAENETPTIPATEKARRERRRALILPREHGAWGLLLVPMVTGAGVAFHQTVNIVPFALLLTAALALFWLRTPLESLLGTSAMRAQTADERRIVAIVIAGLSTVAALTLGTLLWGENPLLWLIGAAAGAASRAGESRAESERTEHGAGSWARDRAECGVSSYAKFHGRVLVPTAWRICSTAVI